jgi:hypothetical protein
MDCRQAAPVGDGAVHCVGSSSLFRCFFEISPFGGRGRELKMPAAHAMRVLKVLRRFEGALKGGPRLLGLAEPPVGFSERHVQIGEQNGILRPV